MKVRQFLNNTYDSSVPAFVVDYKDINYIDAKPLQKGTIREVANGKYADCLVIKWGVSSMFDKELECFVGCLELYVEKGSRCE